MANEFARNIVDATLLKTTAFAAAGASANSDSIDLGSTSSYEQGVDMECQISWPALANLVDTKTIIFTVESSTDDSTFVTLGITKTLTGAGGVGVAAGTFRFRIPSDSNRYIRINQATLAAGGDNTASSSTLKLLF